MPGRYDFLLESPSPTPGQTQGNGRYDFLLGDEPSATPTSTTAAVPSAPPLLTPAPVGSEKTNQALEDANAALSQLDREEQDKERQAAAELKPYGPEVPRIRPETQREHMLGELRSFLAPVKMGGTMVPGPEPLIPPQVARPLVAIPGMAGRAIGNLLEKSTGRPYGAAREAIESSLANQLTEMSRPNALLSMAQQLALSPVSVPAFLAERGLSIPDQIHKFHEAIQKHGVVSPEFATAAAEELPTDLMAAAAMRFPGIGRGSPLAIGRQIQPVILPRGLVPTPSGWMMGNQGNVFGRQTGFVMPGADLSRPPYVTAPPTYVGPPIPPQATIRPPGRFEPSPGEAVGEPVPQQPGVKPYAVKPSIPQVPRRETTQREQEGTVSEEQAAGDSNIPVGAAEGEEAGRKLPPPSPLTPLMEEAVRQVHRERGISENAVPNPDLAASYKAKATAISGKPLPLRWDEDLKNYIDEANTPKAGKYSLDQLKGWYTLGRTRARLKNNLREYEHFVRRTGRRDIGKESAILDSLQEVNDKIHARIERSGEPREFVIIGGGPSGLQAAINAAYEGTDVLLLEKAETTGGASRYSQEILNVGAGKGYGVSGHDLWQATDTLARINGAQVRTGVEVNKAPTFDPETKLYTVETATGEKIQARRVQIATGRRPVIYDELGPAAINQNAEEFERQTADSRHGIGILLGAGNSATQALMGAMGNPKVEKVYMILRGRDAETALQKDASSEQLQRIADYVDQGRAEIVFGDTVSNGGKVLYDKNGKMTGVVTKNGKEIKADTLGVFQQSQRNTEFLPPELLGPPTKIPGRTFMESGVVKVGPNFETSMPGLYATGEILGMPGKAPLPVTEEQIAGMKQLGLDPAMYGERERAPRIKEAQSQGTNVSNQVQRQLAQEFSEGNFDSLWRQMLKDSESVVKRPETGEPLGTGLMEMKRQEQMQRELYEKTSGPKAPPEISPGSSTIQHPVKESLKGIEKLPPPAPPPSIPGQPEQQPGPKRPPIGPVLPEVPWRSEIPGKPEFPPRQEPAAPGEPIIEKPAELAWVQGAAESRVADNPRLPDQLVSGILDGERPGLDQVDSQVLLNKKAQLQDARDKAGQRLMDQSLPDGDRAEALATFEDLDNEVRQIDRATDDGNLLKGQSQSRQWHSFRQRDYDFNGMEQKMVAAKNGAPLTTAEEAALRKKTDALSTAMMDLEGVTRRTGFYPGKFKRGDPGYDDIRNAQEKAFNAKTALDDSVWQEKLRTAGKMAQAAHVAHELIGLQRALMTSFDFSAVRRQGGIFFMGHPMRSIGEMPDMLRAAASDKQYFRLMQDIRERPNAELYRTSKLALTDVTSPNITQMEEAYMSRWANAIPIVNHSQRAYVYFLNRMRADTFDAMAATLTRHGVPTAAQAEAISNFINVFTGRGHLGKDYANSSAVLNDVFFAPRYVLSRWQALTFQPLRYTKDPAVRKLIAQEYARSIAGYAVVYGLANTALKDFVDVGKDPSDPDFGKLKIKGTDTRIDFLSGLSQQMVFGYREGSLAYEQLEHQLRTGEPLKYPLTHRGPLAVAQDYLRTKYAPLPSMYFNATEGKKVTGEPTTIGKELWDSLHPISGQDIYDSMKTYGMPEGVALGLLTTFGDNVQTYGTRASSGGRTRQRRRGRVH